MNGVSHELVERSNNIGLKSNIESFIKEVPTFLQGNEKPIAILARHVATPNFEAFHFVQTAQEMGFLPVVWQFSGDTFCTKNPDKADLGRLRVYKGKQTSADGTRQDLCQKMRVIDMEKNERKPINAITARNGENFVEMHNRLFQKHLPQAIIWDSTEWLMLHGTNAKEFYIYFLSLFISHAVLFENFLTVGQEVPFVQDVVRPAINGLKQRFGFSPIIIPAVPLDSESKKTWTWYPQAIIEDIQKVPA